MKKTPPGFTRTLLSIAIPVTLQNLLASSFTLVDTLMIGALGDMPLAAVGMAGKWTWFLTIVFFGFASGASVFIAQYYGADDAADVVDDEDMTEEEKAEALSPIATAFNESSGGHGRLAAYAFMIFNLLCAPCFAAIGAMKREFNNAKWTLAAVGYQCAFAYVVALIVYQLGLLFSGAGFTVATAIAILLLAGLVYLVVRKNPYNDNHLTQKVSA